MPEFQTTRNVIAKMAGLSGFIEVVSNIETKRLSDPIPVIKGDGRNQVKFIHDPARIVSPVTFEIIPEKEKALALYVRQLFDQHKRNPASAGALEIRSYDDDGGIVDQATMPNAVIQSVKASDGNTMQHQESKIIVTVQPLDIF